eukprot:120592_1
MLMFIIKHIFEKYNENNQFNTFPKILYNQIESTKKIEAKTIRDGIADMKDSLERIGKRIKRANRNLKEVQNKFHEKAADALTVLFKLKKRTNKLKLSKLNKSKKKSLLGVGIEDEYDDGGYADNEDNDDDDNKNKKKKKKKKKAISFADG